MIAKEDLYKKIVNMAEHNQIVKLKYENNKKDEKLKKISEEGKKILDKYGEKNKLNINKLNERIKELEKQLNEMKQERNYYKELLEKIPSFIRKIFIKDKTMIEE